MAVILTELKSELQTDPNGYGYAALITQGNHQGLANMLNLPRTAVNNGTVGVAITVRRGVRTGINVMNCIALADYDALTVSRQQYLIALVTPVEGVDLSDDVIRANLSACFPAGATRTRLIAIADKTPASRGEQLFGIDTGISASQIAAALNS